MTSTPLDRDLSVRDLLFGQTQAGEEAVGLGEALRGRQVARSALGGFRHLGGAALGAVDEEVGDLAEGMLDISLGEALVHGWSRHRQLRESARRTLSTSGSEVVPLAAHKLTSTYRPKVDLLVDRAMVGSIEFEVRLVFEVTGVAAVIRSGCLVAVRGGDVLVTATMLVYGDTIARRQRRLDPELVVLLDPPVALAAPPPEG